LKPIAFAIDSYTPVCQNSYRRTGHIYLVIVLGWKEFLEDYEQEEIENIDRFMKEVHDSNLTSLSMYPPAHRFPKLCQPVSRLLIPSTLDDVPAILWSSVLLSGTTIGALTPHSQSTFEDMHGFKIREIPEIIDFIKRSGKLAFRLREPPTAYKNLEFLEPIFEELRPPVMIKLPLTVFFDEKEIRKHMVEFSTLASINFWNHVGQGLRNVGLGLGSLVETMDSASEIYACLKALGYRDLVEEIENLVVLNPSTANDRLIQSRDLITGPLRETFTTSRIFDRHRYSMQKAFAESQVSSLPKPQFPGEIGKFMFGTLMHSPPSLDTCEELCMHYEEHDVYKVANALNEGIIQNEPDAVKKKSAELSTIMNNLWETKKLQRKSLGVRFGIHVLFGAVGPVAMALTGGLSGVLTGLGFEVGNAFFAIKSDKIAEKIAKRLSPNWEAIVYDFKRKYKLTESTRKLGKENTEDM